MADTTEAEMITRLADATRQSADFVAQICNCIVAGVPIRPRTLVDLRHALRQASGSAHQLGHAQQNPQFFALRDALDDLTRGAFGAAVIQSPRRGVILAKIGATLESLRDEAVRMATAKPVGRQQVLAMADARERLVKTRLAAEQAKATVH